jgi:hypothetical protein
VILRVSPAMGMGAPGVNAIPGIASARLATLARSWPRFITKIDISTRY